jgi:hypothetical protein
MRRYGSREICVRGMSLVAVFIGLSAHLAGAQATSREEMAPQIQRLTDAMTHAEAQLAQSQRQLEEIRQQLEAVKRQFAASGSSGIAAPENAAAAPHEDAASIGSVVAANNSALDEIREHQALQDSQIATHEQTKVESESKYPVKLTGLLLLNGFVNTRAVDAPATPTLSLPGSGSTGASVRQTVLGFDARGPHLLGARSYADMRVDFAGSPASSNAASSYDGYYGANDTLLRLRTAHAGLQWERTGAYFSLDKPLISPDSPTSLAAVANPALAWSGNLWTWNPQVGVTQNIDQGTTHDVRLQAALIDVGDAPVLPTAIVTPISPIVSPSSSERSRWPGAEARIAWLGSRQRENGNHFGIGGYFSPHLTPSGKRYDSWAATLDANMMLPLRLQLTGNFYRGLALGGLGGGAYKDYAYLAESNSTYYYILPLDDVGGWTQLKEKWSERLEFNAAFGMDNSFSKELRRYFAPGGSVWQNLARNRTYTGNVIYSPNAYLMFSLEYRRLESAPVEGLTWGSNVAGAAVGYRF